MIVYTVHPAGTTGNGRTYIANLQDARRLEVELNVTAVGATPTVTFAVEGLLPGTDPTVAANWIALATLTADASVATSSAAVVMSSVSKTRRFIDGLDKRFFDAIGINATANTNVTYTTQINRAD